MTVPVTLVAVIALFCVALGLVLGFLFGVIIGTQVLAFILETIVERIEMPDINLNVDDIDEGEPDDGEYGWLN